jgi:penicillin-insensitive murein endopeptidase
MTAAVLSASAGCAHPAWSNGELAPSFGSPSHGALLRGAALAPRGNGYEVFRTHEQGGEDFALPRVIEMVRSAASTVRRESPGGAPLRVGDMSSRRGGHIERHASHRNGRDADLLFFALDAEGHSVPTPAFIRYDAHGVSMDAEHPLVFDVRRNWQLVESLAREPRFGVIWIFCASRLRTLLLAWAREHGRDPEIIARAEDLLRQPGDSAPHDDHFHVRVACTRPERTHGCRDGGPIWWWLEREWGKDDSAPSDDETVLTLLAPIDTASLAADPTSATAIDDGVAPSPARMRTFRSTLTYRPDGPR